MFGSESDFEYVPSISTQFEDDKSGKEEMTLEDTLKTLERNQLKFQQLCYFNGLFQSIYQDLYMNILACSNGNLSLWPHFPYYEPMYVDAITKTEFNPLDPIKSHSLLENLLSGSLKEAKLKEIQVEKLGKALLLKMEELYRYLNLIRNKLICNIRKQPSHLWTTRPLDAADTLFCFLLICGHQPSNLLVRHVSRHLKILKNQTYCPFNMTKYLTKHLASDTILDIDICNFIKEMYNCLIINDICIPQIYHFERKILFMHLKL
eukprot:NODE_13_length_54415_cov_0.522424.p24 type:complete len:263 gc:universal NODE_13_length_54415_cov_0.522424:38141-37353(-)